MVAQQVHEYVDVFVFQGPPPPTVFWAGFSVTDLLSVRLVLKLHCCVLMVLLSAGVCFEKLICQYESYTGDKYGANRT